MHYGLTRLNGQCHLDHRWVENQLGKPLPSPKYIQRASCWLNARLRTTTVARVHGVLCIARTRRIALYSNR